MKLRWDHLIEPEDFATFKGSLVYVVYLMGLNPIYITLGVPAAFLIGDPKLRKVAFEQWREMFCSRARNAVEDAESSGSGVVTNAESSGSGVVTNAESSGATIGVTSISMNENPKNNDDGIAVIAT